MCIYGKRTRKRQNKVHIFMNLIATKDIFLNSASCKFITTIKDNDKINIPTTLTIEIRDALLIHTNHLEQRPPNIYNGQGHCVMRSVYMFGKVPIRFSRQTECINLRPSVDGSSAF
ncbi:conserved hypothetical protein [Trichinella spiralis]|uniref:hypothetical protein n=1 Tax=Trichinella spiralis TaxID=6334 RepID=UPI0001EFB5A4|nr:conserved hypothetical protein [Trichinella spiralis]